MKATHLRRSLVAVATVVAWVPLMANPAIATTHALGITGFEVTLTKTGITPQVLDLGPSTSSCGNIGSSAEEDGTTFAIIDFFRDHVTHLASSNYLAIFTRSTTGNSSGTLNSTSTPHTITSMRVAVVVAFYNTTDCDPTGSPICTLAFLLHMSGTATSTTLLQTLTITGLSVGTIVAFPTCTSGPSYLIGTSSSVTSPLVAIFDT